jgi:hypothetical protein
VRPPSINRPEPSWRPEGSRPSITSWTGFLRANGRAGISVTASSAGSYSADLSLIVLAFFAVYEPVLPGRVRSVGSRPAAVRAEVGSGAERETPSGGPGGRDGGPGGGGITYRRPRFGSQLRPRFGSPEPCQPGRRLRGTRPVARGRAAAP